MITKDQIWTVPNALSVGRLILIPVFIYVLLVERYVRFIGDVSAEDIVKYETIQFLCVSSMSNSKLKNTLNLIKGVNVDEQILEVADFRKPKSGCLPSGI